LLEKERRIIPFYIRYDVFIDTIDSLVLGQRVRHYRKQRQLRLDDLGALVGKPAPYLSMVENGKREPTLGLINDLATALGVPAGDLLVPEPPRGGPSSKSPSSVSNASRRIGTSGCRI